MGFEKSESLLAIKHLPHWEYSVMIFETVGLLSRFDCMILQLLVARRQTGTQTSHACSGILAYCCWLNSQLRDGASH